MTEITIEARDKYDVTHKRVVKQAEFETDEAFIVRVAAALEDLRREVP